MFSLVILTGLGVPSYLYLKKSVESGTVLSEAMEEVEEEVQEIPDTIIIDPGKPQTEKKNSDPPAQQKQEASEKPDRDPKSAIPPDSILINHLLGKFNYSKDPYFIAVKEEHSSKSLYVQKETYTKFKEMHAAAKKDGISLIIISGTRNFNEQKAIWERKWDANIKSKDSIKAARNVLLFSSMPTTSRHHWGTDIDINSLDNEYFTSGKGLKEYNWLVKNGKKYGFCQVYTDKKDNNRTGYEMEKWHWSYLPIASPYLAKYEMLVSYSLIKGFKGAQLAKKLNSIEDYVKGIDKSCKLAN